MGYTPIVQGATLKPLQVTWKLDGDTPAVPKRLNLAGLTLSVEFETNVGGTPLSFAGTGTFNSIDAANGVFSYTYNANDVASTGQYELRFKATDGSNHFEMADKIPLQIDPA